MVMAQPLLARLKSDADAAIDILALPWIAALVSRMPEVEQVVAMPVGHGRLAIKQRYRIGRSLRGRYQRAIVLPNSLKSALIPWFAKIPQRSGYVGEKRYGIINDIHKLDVQARPLLVQRYAALALSARAVSKQPDRPADFQHDRPKLTVQAAQASATLQQLKLASPGISPIGLCPGAEYGPAKRWPAEYYAELANRVLAQGRSVWLFGSDKDQPITAAINQACGERCVDLAGRTTLDQAIDLLSLCDDVVSNDSGLMHIACALGRRVIALFGSSSPQYTPPLSDQAVIVQHEIECSPCFKRVCPLGHTHCLTELGVDTVFEKLH